MEKIVIVIISGIVLIILSIVSYRISDKGITEAERRIKELKAEYKKQTGIDYDKE